MSDERNVVLPKVLVWPLKALNKEAEEFVPRVSESPKEASTIEAWDSRRLVVDVNSVDAKVTVL